MAPTTLSRAETVALRHLVDEAFALLDGPEPQAARASIAEAVALAPERGEVLLLQAELALVDDDRPTAEAHLRRAVLADPDLADAHHLLARLLEDRGAHEEMVAHDLRVHELDGRADRLAQLGTPDDLAFIEEQARIALERLPMDLAERVADVPVVLEPRPSLAIVREGFDPRALGLFEGPTDHLRRIGEVDVRPTRIVLYYANLLTVAEDDDALAEQIEITVLHEVGHYFGLDEDEVAELGLA